ncbi:unnamed protein product [Linum trigynum]|uniref:Reverse transcriptase RNase H-like domain-containing protein n=1 Tax=Linum trigynum TaxID=586398 RepID=A0AAV2GKE1_9ROSI
MREDRPITFMSRALGTQKQWLSAYAKEMMVVIAAVQLWRPYLLGRKFYICTDQRSLWFLLEQRITTPEQQKWVTRLFGYDYEIMYKPEKENQVADALSRRPLISGETDKPTMEEWHAHAPTKAPLAHKVVAHLPPDDKQDPNLEKPLECFRSPTVLHQLTTLPSDENVAGILVDQDLPGEDQESRHNYAEDMLHGISYLFTTLGDSLKHATANDPYLQAVKEKVRSLTPGHFSVKDDMALYDERLVLSADSPLINQLLQEYHSKPTGGHSGVLCTYRRLAAQFFWPDMLETVK